MDEVMSSGLRRAADIIRSSTGTVALTGAGISVESHIPPFRGENGLWQRYDPEEYAHIRSFTREPEKVWVMLKELVDTCLNAEPNRAHVALAEMEKRGILKGIITQNIDGLHQRAGSREVVEFHGGNNTMSCLTCRKKCRTEEVSLAVIPPRCECGGLLRPDFVFFGEQIPPENLYRAMELSRNCGVMLIIGTTGLVVPAAQMPQMARSAGAALIEINPGHSAYAGMVDVFLKGKAGDVMEGIVGLL